MKRILLISPPFYRLMGSHYNGIHLGLGYIAAVLNKHGHMAEIYNADFSNSDLYLDQRQLFNNFDLYKNILNNTEHAIWKDISRTIKNVNPDYIGIQMYTATFKSAQNIANIAKFLNSKIKIVVGGTHPSLDPEGTMRSGPYDYVVRGEGEYTFLDIVNEVEPSQIKGLTFRNKEGTIISNDDRLFIENLDMLPFPVREQIYIEKEKIDSGAIITSRGCPFKCAYCASPRIWQKKVRYRSVENILEELEYIKKQLNVPIVRFQDDTFTLNKNRAVEICEGILKRDLNIKWICDTRVDKLDKNLLCLMKKAGCIRIKIGVESGSDRILKSVKKGIVNEQIKRAVKIIKEVDIPLTIYLMIGFPDETDKEIEQTIHFAEEINADYNSLSIVAPYYGTQMYEDLKKKGFGFDRQHWEYFFHQSREMIINKNISAQMIDRFFSLNEKGKGERV